MLVAILVLVVTSLMLVSAFARGWVPAVDVLGSWIFLAPIAWGIIAVPMTLLAPPWMVVSWASLLWIVPIIAFLVDAAINHPLDFILTAPPAVA